MALQDYFLPPSAGSNVATIDNDVTLFDDNAAYFAAISRDLKRATMPDHYIYFAGWWTDLDIPLGDPNAKPVPPTLRGTLMSLAKGKPPAPTPMTPAGRVENQLGPEVCCMVWQQFGQWDPSVAAKYLLAPVPTWLFGPPLLSRLNSDAADSVDGLRGVSAGFLDNATLMFGSHHQKFMVIQNDAGLVAYLGSSDFNADRLYAVGDQRAKNPTDTKGAPLNDVNIRLSGLAAADVLKTFVDRWTETSQAPRLKLAGVTQASVDTRRVGDVTVQITHTYGKGYPFKKAVRTAADAQLRLVNTAQQYIYYEDQYLIGTDEIGDALKTRLAANGDLVIIGIMAPAIIADVPWMAQRRSDFWAPLYAQFGPSEQDRVLLFEMMNANNEDNGPGSYLHNKMTIVDDAVATVGTVNFSQRSWAHDSEIMATFGGTGGTVPNVPATDANSSVARRVRLMRWARHLGQSPSDVDRLPDGLARWRKLPTPGSRVRRWQPSAVSTLAMGLDVLGVYEAAYATLFDP